MLSNQELNPTQHLLTTQATTRWSRLAPWLGECSHLIVHLEGHVIHLFVHWNFAPSLYPGVQKNLRITILIWNSSCKYISCLNLGNWEKFVDVCCCCHTESNQKSLTKSDRKSQDITYARGFTSKFHYTNWSSNSRPWRPTGATPPSLILLCNWPSCLLLVGHFKGPMEMLERDHDFQCSGFCVCFKGFFQVNGLLDLVAWFIILIILSELTINV